MAQSGNFTPILLYASSTPTNVPSAGNLTNSATGSEIAINIADKNLFFKDSTNAVNTVPIRQSNTSLNGWLSATDWNTFNGKAPATSGTSLLYGNGSGGFSNATIGSGLSFIAGTLTATGSGGTVTSVTGTSPVVSSGGTTPAISLATAYGDTLNPYASKTAKYVLAAPNGSAGVPTFRQLANTDITGLGTMSTQNANSVAITGGTLNGVAIGGTTAGDGSFDVLVANVTRLTNVTSSAGIVITGTFSGSAPTDGLVMDYATGWGRFSDFGGDGFQWFNAGLATTKLMELSSAGALTTTSTVTANGVLLTGNLGTVTSVTGTAPVVSSGGTTPAISMAAANTTTNGYLTSTDWNTFNGKSNTNGTVTSVAALTLGTTGTDLSSTVANGTTTPVITLQVPTASATNRGALSAADWTTFNSKAPAVTYTTNYIPYGQGTTTPNQSANLTYDGTNLKVIGSITSSVANSATKQLSLSATNGANADCNIWLSTNYTLIAPSTATPLAFGTATTEQMRLFNSGGFSIGNTTDPGATNLSVTGTVKTSGALLGSSTTLLNDYQEGTFTPTYSSWTINPTTSNAFYTKIGRQVTINMLCAEGVTAGGGIIGNLPFTSKANQGATATIRGINSNINGVGSIPDGSTQIQNIGAMTNTGYYWTLSVTYIV